MTADTLPEFQISKRSGNQALLFLDFLEAVNQNSIKLLPEEGNCVLTVQHNDKKYHLTCEGEELTLDVIDLVEIRKRLTTVK